VALAVVATTAARGAVKPAGANRGVDGNDEDAPARLSVAVDALNGRVSVTPIETGEKKAGEPAAAPPLPTTPTPESTSKSESGARGTR
jgi:hypothetical protein